MILSNQSFNWLDLIPNQWEIDRVKDHFYFSNIQTENFDNYPVLSLTMSGVKKRNIDTNEGQHPESYEKYNLVDPSCLVFNPMDLISGWVDVPKTEGLISPSYRTIKLRSDKTNLHFIKYYFQSLYKEKVLFYFGEGVHYDYRWGLGKETLKNFPIPIPPKEEQNKIVGFLDKKTNQIDEIIKKIEKKIELHKEQRISLINEVVTKGLNPNVEMKDSGIEWIGEIPRHWNYKRMCYMFRPVSIKNNFDEMNLSVYRDYGVIPTHSRDDNHNVISEDTSNYKLVDIGDFVMNKMKCWMGSLGLSDFRGIVSPSYTVMKPLTEDNRKFLHFLLRSKVYIPQYKRLSYGIRTGQWDLHYKDFRELPCLIPPLKEQKEIVKYLEIETQRIDEIMFNEEKRIELLKDYKQSLISEVVTGKKRVV